MRRAITTPVCYPQLYTWLVFVAAMDVMLTHLVLYFGGREANRMAAGVMERWGFEGMIAYKFVLVGVIVVLCELIGRRDAARGRLLGILGVGLTCIPVALGFLLLTIRLYFVHR